MSYSNVIYLATAEEILCDGSQVHVPRLAFQVAPVLPITEESPRGGELVVVREVIFAHYTSPFPSPSLSCDVSFLLPPSLARTCSAPHM
jgi:hypothetical protein